MFPPLAPLPSAEGTRFRVIAKTRPGLQLHGPGGTRTVAVPGSGPPWEVFVPGIGAGQHYTWIIAAGQPLLDPYGLAIDADQSVVVAPPEAVEWKRPPTQWQESVLYELHVRGYTQDDSSQSEHPGTYLGLIDRIGYLKELGVTAVELMPVHEFADLHDGRTDFWGYSPIAWFAPKRGYAVAAPIEEFRTMVQAFHAAGIQVILDVVFNHTAELDAQGPTLHLRGLDRERYYLERDFTGCGNTIRAQEPMVRALILDALRWWVHGMGVDGFRFDLATVLSRDEQGAIMDAPPLLREIEQDEALRGIHLVAEAWDAGGGYQVGSWPGGTGWAVQNDRFRDDVREAWLGIPERARALARRLEGSPDLFPLGPARALNFITSHDGFTLQDVVSYSRRHNEANGEGGRDGNPHEPCSNHGAEGDTKDATICARRERTRRNLIAALLLARGVPMLLAGDEFGRTQQGNNNPYCHDSRLTWVNWTHPDEEKEFLAFVRRLVRLRRSTKALQSATPPMRWLGPAGGPPDWERGLFGYELERELLVLINLSDLTARFEIGDHWRLEIDTGGLGPAQMDAHSLAAFRHNGD